MLLLLLQRFVPFGTRDPQFTMDSPQGRTPLSPAALRLRGLIGGAVACGSALLLMATLAALEELNRGSDRQFPLLDRLFDLLWPQTLPATLELLGALVFAAVCGLLTAAVSAARHGSIVRIEDEEL